MITNRMIFSEVLEMYTSIIVPD